MAVRRLSAPGAWLSLVVVSNPSDNVFAWRRVPVDAERVPDPQLGEFFLGLGLMPDVAGMADELEGHRQSPDGL